MEENSVIIELDTVLEYRDGQVYIKKMVTSEMTAPTMSAGFASGISTLYIILSVELPIA